MSKTSYLFFITIFCLSINLYGQSEANYEMAEKYCSEAETLNKAGKYSKAVNLLEKASEIYLQARDYNKLVSVENKKAEYFINSNQAQKAKNILIKLKEKYSTEITDNEQKYALFKNLGLASYYLAEYDQLVIFSDSLQSSIKKNQDTSKNLDLYLFSMNIKGAAYLEKANYELAILVFKEMLNISGIEETRYLQLAYSNLNSCYFNLGNIEKSLKYQNLSEELLISNGLTQSISMVNSYNVKAGLYYKLGNLESANTFYLKAINLCKKIDPNNTSTLPLLYSNLGLLYSHQGLFEKAIDFFFLSETLYDKNEYGLWRVYNELGRCYKFMKDYKKSEEYCKKAIEITEKIFGKTNINTLSVYIELAYLKKDIGNYNEAIKYLNFIEKHINVDNHNRIKTAMLLAECYHGQKKYHLSLKKNREAFKISEALNYLTDLSTINSLIAQSLFSIGKKDSANIYWNRAIEEMRETHLEVFEFTLGHTLLNKALTEREDKKYKEASGTLKQLDEWINNMKQKDWSIDEVDRLNSFNVSYLSVVLTLKKHSDLDDLWFAYEDSKMFNLKTSIQRFRHNQIDASQLLKQKEKEKSEIASLRGQAIGDLPKYKRDSVQQLISESQIFISEISQKIKTQYPNYHKLKYSTETIALEETQSRLEANQALIEYFVGDSSIYAFTITNDLAEIEKLEIQPNELSKLVKNFRQGLSKPDADWNKYLNNGHKLYQSILQGSVQKLPKGIKHLIIVPDGELGYVPFESLLTQKAEGENYVATPYLVRDYQISYAYSATLLFDGFQHERNPSNDGVLSFAPAYKNSKTDSIQLLALGKFRDQITSLVWNQKEAEQIIQYVAGKPFVGEFATERAFKQNAGDYNILHLAMHALVDDQNPMYSRLVFTQSEDSVEDNYLNAYELYNMKLNANLAVLSACNTGYGKLVRGEGIMSLARGFAYAGCPSVVMSHWQVDDEATSKLMEYFYEGLSDGMTKSEALRSAQLKYLETAEPRQAHPFYWSSFVMIGEDTPIKSSSNFIYWVGLLFLGLGIALIMKMRGKK